MKFFHVLFLVCVVRFSCADEIADGVHAALSKVSNCYLESLTVLQDELAKCENDQVDLSSVIADVKGVQDETSHTITQTQEEIQSCIDGGDGPIACHLGALPDFFKNIAALVGKILALNQDYEGLELSEEAQQCVDKAVEATRDSRMQCLAEE